MLKRGRMVDDHIGFFCGVGLVVVFFSMLVVFTLWEGGYPTTGSVWVARRWLKGNCTAAGVIDFASSGCDDDDSGCNQGGQVLTGVTVRVPVPDHSGLLDKVREDRCGVQLLGEDTHWATYTGAVGCGLIEDTVCSQSECPGDTTECSQAVEGSGRRHCPPLPGDRWEARVNSSMTCWAAMRNPQLVSLVDPAVVGPRGRWQGWMAFLCLTLIFTLCICVLLPDFMHGCLQLPRLKDMQDAADKAEEAERRLELLAKAPPRPAARAARPARAVPRADHKKAKKRVSLMVDDSGRPAAVAPPGGGAAAGEP